MSLKSLQFDWRRQIETVVIMYTIIVITVLEIHTWYYGSPEKVDQTQPGEGRAAELPGILTWPKPGHKE